MESLPKDASAKTLREEGNALYKQGKLNQAVEKYEAAVIADPRDPLPTSNLSAVLFELGKYPACFQAAANALQISQSSDESLKKKLHPRILQAILQHGGLPEAAASSDHPIGVFIPKELSKTRQRMASMLRYGSETRVRKVLLQLLPLCKPIVYDLPAWGPYGHDLFQSLFDNKLAAQYGLPTITRGPRLDMRLEDLSAAQAATSAQEISFFFGGIGDARHLYTTWMSLASSLVAAESAIIPRICIVANDFKPHLLARNIIIWHLMDQVAVAHATGSVETMRFLSTIFYVFCAPIMPRQMWELLQTAISECIEMLQDARPSPEWVSFPAESRPPVLAVLATWQGEVNDLYDVEAFQVSMKLAMGNLPPIGQMPNEDSSLPEPLQVEQKCYNKTMFLAPDRATLDSEAVLAQLYRQFRKDQTKVKRLKQHVASTWKVNPTLFDLEHEKMENNIGEIYPEPWQLPDFIYTCSGIQEPEHATSLLDYVTPFLTTVIGSLKLLRTSMKVHVSLGDVARQLEELRYLEEESGMDPKLPLHFDRMHLSNVPDYVGMGLFTFIYATPMLKTHDAAFVTYNCLTCPPRWTSLETYNADSLLLYKKADLARALNVRHAGRFEGGPNPMANIMFFAGDYYSWKSIINGSLKFESLLPRADFNHWLYGLLLKLALPAFRDHDKHKFGVSMMVRAPLNMTAFPKLLIHLRSIGYPSHWMGQILTNIITDNVVTTARPPTTCPISLKEVSAREPPMKFSMLPFLAEMSTLTAQFLRILPFAVIVDDGVIPGLESIREYTVTFNRKNDPPRESCDAVRADWILVFAKWDELSRVLLKRPFAYTSTQFRSALMDEDLLRQMRGGFHVVTTWTWDRGKRQVRFWLREDVGEEVRKIEKGWRVEVFRTDLWGPMYRDMWQRNVEWKVGSTWAEMLNEKSKRDEDMDDFQSKAQRVEGTS